eukprot:680508-Alexandrium_andersonii.AAC.1
MGGARARCSVPPGCCDLSTGRRPLRGVAGAGFRRPAGARSCSPAARRTPALAPSLRPRRLRPLLGTTPLFSALLLVLLLVGESIPGVLVAELCVLPDWHGGALPAPPPPDL